MLQNHDMHHGLIVAGPCVGRHVFVYKHGSVTLSPGLHALRVDYFQRDAPDYLVDAENGGLVLQVTLRL